MQGIQHMSSCTERMVNSILHTLPVWLQEDVRDTEKGPQLYL